MINPTTMTPILYRGRSGRLLSALSESGTHVVDAANFPKVAAGRLAVAGTL
jgi:hypothetical protein